VDTAQRAANEQCDQQQRRDRRILPAGLHEGHNLLRQLQLNSIVSRLAGVVRFK
jgi:hypothetical protein